MATLHPKIKELKQKATQIQFNNVSVEDDIIVRKLETRASLLDERIVEGYAVIWGIPNFHREIFKRGSFSKAINDLGPESNSNYKIKFCDNHGEAVELFEELREDEIGLYFKTRALDNSDESNRILRKLKSGVYNNFSIGFRYVWDKMYWDEEQEAYIIDEARLLEISVVGVPSDIHTFAIRSQEDLENLFDDTEDFINRLPRKDQLEARKLFTLHKSLSLNKQQEEENRKALIEQREQGEQINYNYLIKNL